MSARNRDVVRAMFDAFSRRDARALVAVAHPDIVFCPPTRRLAERDEPYRGHDGLRA